MSATSSLAFPSGNSLPLSVRAKPGTSRVAPRPRAKNGGSRVSGRVDGSRRRVRCDRRRRERGRRVRREKKDAVRRFVEEVMNGGDLEAADELVATDPVNNDPTAPAAPPGRAGAIDRRGG